MVCSGITPALKSVPARSALSLSNVPMVVQGELPSSRRVLRMETVAASQSRPGTSQHVRLCVVWELGRWECAGTLLSCVSTAARLCPPSTWLIPLCLWWGTAGTSGSIQVKTAPSVAGGSGAMLLATGTATTGPAGAISLLVGSTDTGVRYCLVCPLSQPCIKAFRTRRCRPCVHWTPGGTSRNSSFSPPPLSLSLSLSSLFSSL